MNFAWNKFDLNAPSRANSNLFGAVEPTVVGFQTPNPAPVMLSPASSNISMDGDVEYALINFLHRVCLAHAPPPTHSDLMDDDSAADLSRTESSMSDAKFLPSTPGSMDAAALRSISRQQSKLAPHVMQISLPPLTAKEISDNSEAIARLQQVAMFVLPGPKHSGSLLYFFRLRDNLTNQWADLQMNHGQLLAAHTSTPGFLQANRQAFDSLQFQLQAFTQSVNDGARLLFEIIQNVLADAAGLAAVRSELAELELLGAKADLYLQELIQLSANPGGFPVCSIRISQQPLPVVYSKGKEADDTYVRRSARYISRRSAD